MTRMVKQLLDVRGARLCLYRVRPSGPRRGTVLVPPLIGGSALQQYGFFRALCRRGWELALFDYRGHARSTGRFDFASSFRDTRAVALELRRDRDDEPLFGLADCYGAIPLLHTAGREPSLFSGLALFSPVWSLRHVAGPLDALRIWLRSDEARRRRNPFDLRGCLLAVNQVLFPEVLKSRDHFGILEYDRARTAACLATYLFASPLRGVCLPEVPARVVYGRADSLLGVDSPGGEERLRAAFARMLPAVEFRVTEEADHYWTGVDRLANDLADEFFSGVLGTAPEARAPYAIPSVPRSEPEGGRRLASATRAG